MVKIRAFQIIGHRGVPVMLLRTALPVSSERGNWGSPTSSVTCSSVGMSTLC